MKFMIFSNKILQNPTQHVNGFTIPKFITYSSTLLPKKRCFSQDTNYFTPEGAFGTIIHTKGH